MSGTFPGLTSLLRAAASAPASAYIPRDVIPTAKTFAELMEYQARGIYTPNSAALVGVKVVLTGTMSSRRDMVETFLSQHTATIGKAIARSDSPSGLLIVANHEMDAFKAGQGGSSKLRDAKNWGVTMLSESEIVGFLQGGEVMHASAPTTPTQPKVVLPPPDHYGDF